MALLSLSGKYHFITILLQIYDHLHNSLNSCLFWQRCEYLNQLQKYLNISLFFTQTQAQMCKQKNYTNEYISKVRIVIGCNSFLIFTWFEKGKLIFKIKSLKKRNHSAKWVYHEHFHQHHPTVITKTIVFI